METRDDVGDFGKFTADSFKTILKIPEKIPSHDTFNGQHILIYCLELTMPRIENAEKAIK